MYVVKLKFYEKETSLEILKLECACLGLSGLCLGGSYTGP